MNTKTLSNGVEVPIIGLGTWNLEGMEEEAVGWALEAGYRHIDTAKIYGTEAGIGRAIEASSTIPREEIFITTKLWNTDQGYTKALRAIDESLKKLDTPYVDLYLIHWPYTGGATGENRREETWRAMEEIYESGRARAIGVSNYEILHLSEMEEYARIPPMVNQIERHPFKQQRDIVAYCDAHDIAITNYSPLTRGKNMHQETISRIAGKHGKTEAQILLRWGVQQGNIVIPKAAQQSHIEENMNIFDFDLEFEDMEILNGLEEQYSML